MDAKELFIGMDDDVLVEVAQAAFDTLRERSLDMSGLLGSLATDAAQATEAPVDAIETGTSERLPLRESLLSGFDRAYKTYTSQIGLSNTERAAVKNRNKPEQLKVVDQSVIEADIAAILATPGVVAELQAEIIYFSEYPETDSPAPGFDLLIVPEGLVGSDEQAIAKDLQARIDNDYSRPSIRPSAYNDKRISEITGKGYRVVFAPRHYNIPKGTTSEQTSWMKAQNENSTVIELQTVTDAEALAFISGLEDNCELNNSSTLSLFYQTHFRRFDQTPLDGLVSDVCVGVYGKLLNLGRSVVHLERSARALVVPKA
jgi:hypothetical protein